MTDLVSRLRNALLQREMIAVPATLQLHPDDPAVKAMTDEVLRTVQAHREIIDAHPLTVYTDEEPGYAQVLNDHLCPGSETPCLTLRALASIYLPDGE